MKNLFTGISVQRSCCSSSCCFFSGAHRFWSGRSSCTCFGSRVFCCRFVTALVFFVSCFSLGFCFCRRRSRSSLFCLELTGACQKKQAEENGAEGFHCSDILVVFLHTCENERFPAVKLFCKKIQLMTFQEGSCIVVPAGTVFMTGRYRILLQVDTQNVLIQRRALTFL